MLQSRDVDCSPRKPPASVLWSVAWPKFHSCLGQQCFVICCTIKDPLLHRATVAHGGRSQIIVTCEPPAASLPTGRQAQWRKAVPIPREQNKTKTVLCKPRVEHNNWLQIIIRISFTIGPASNAVNDGLVHNSSANSIICTNFNSRYSKESKQNKHSGAVGRGRGKLSLFQSVPIK